LPEPVGPRMEMREADGESIVHSKGSPIYKPKLYKQLQTLGVSLQSSPYGQKLVASLSFY